MVVFALIGQPSWGGDNPDISFFHTVIELSSSQNYGLMLSALPILETQKKKKLSYYYTHFLTSLTVEDFCSHILLRVTSFEHNTQ